MTDKKLYIPSWATQVKINNWSSLSNVQFDMYSSDGTSFTTIAGNNTFIDVTDGGYISLTSQRLGEIFDASPEGNGILLYFNGAYTFNGQNYTYIILAIGRGSKDPYLDDSIIGESATQLSISAASNGNIYSQIQYDDLQNLTGADLNINTDNTAWLISSPGAGGGSGSSASSSGDPYVNPINGPRYKLPVDNQCYRLFETEDLIVNAQQWVPSENEAIFMNSFMNTIHTPIGKDEEPFEYVNTGMSFFKDIYVKYKGRSDIINLITQRSHSNTFTLEDGVNESAALTQYEKEHSTTKVIQLGEVTLKIDLFSNLQILTGVTIDAPDSVMQNASGALVYSTNPKLLKVKKLSDSEPTSQAKIEVIKERKAIQRSGRSIEVFGDLNSRNETVNTKLEMF